MNPDVVGNATNPRPVGIPSGGEGTGAFGPNLAQFYFPGFDVPGTAANPSYGYPGYQGVSKDKWCAGAGHARCGGGLCGRR